MRKGLAETLGLVRFERELIENSPYWTNVGWLRGYYVQVNSREKTARLQNPLEIWTIERLNIVLTFQKRSLAFFQLINNKQTSFD